MNGKQAVEKVQLNFETSHCQVCQYKRVLMDLNMPVMDGYDATIEIQRLKY